jgi:tetratricopeptide (TPR) repeat protein
MDNSIDKYIKELRSKLDENFFSPYFIRLANLLYLNKQYDECISVCRTGLEIYPGYLTARLILLKALIKAEYLGRAEKLFKELRSKIDNKPLLSKIEKNIASLKSKTKQEKIFYPESLKPRYDFKNFDKKFGSGKDGNLSIDKFLNMEESGIREDDSFIKMRGKFNNFKFGSQSGDVKNIQHDNAPLKNDPSKEGDDFEFGKIKIVTETLADIFAEQGNFHEAFEAYNFLLRADIPDKQRIEEKIHEMERNMSKEDQV